MVFWIRCSGNLEETWMESPKREDAATTTRESHGIKESEMKFEMEIGWVGDEKITVDTHNFEKIEIIKEFIEFQEAHGWAVNYEAVDNSEDETEEEEIPPFALSTHEPL